MLNYAGIMFEDGFVRHECAGEGCLVTCGCPSHSEPTEVGFAVFQGATLVAVAFLLLFSALYRDIFRVH